MSEPRVVNKGGGGSYDAYVGRPTIWGNPFFMKYDESDRDAVIVQYRDFLSRQPGFVERAQRELKGKTLACWCAPKACHADILLKVANDPRPVDEILSALTRGEI